MEAFLRTSEAEDEMNALRDSFAECLFKDFANVVRQDLVLEAMTWPPSKTTMMQW